MALIPNQRHLFDLPTDIAYLNCAYMSPLLTAAANAGHAGIDRKRQPWRLSASDFFGESERARSLFARLVHADAEGVALMPSVSYAMAIAAQNAEVKGGEILTLAEQFPSNVYPWRRLAADRGARMVTVPRPADRDWTTAVAERIHADTALVALPQCHWTDGGLLDLVRIGKRCREVSAALVIDATQSCAAMPIDLTAVQPNLLVAASYKWMLGPYSLGFAWIGPTWRDGRPIEEGWIGRTGSENFARLVDYQDAYQPGARRFDVGERSNFALMPVAIAAMEQLLEWGVDNIAETLGARTSAIVRRAESLGLRAAPASLRAPHYLGLIAEQPLPDDLPKRLAERDVFVSVRGPAVRVTPHVYTTDDDVDRLFDAFESVLR